MIAAAEPVDLDPLANLPSSGCAAEDEDAAIARADEAEAQELVANWEDEDVEINARRLRAVRPAEAL